MDGTKLRNVSRWYNVTHQTSSHMSKLYKHEVNYWDLTMWKDSIPGWFVISGQAYLGRLAAIIVAGLFAVKPTRRNPLQFVEICQKHVWLLRYQIVMINTCYATEFWENEASCRQSFSLLPIISFSFIIKLKAVNYPFRNNRITAVNIKEARFWVYSSYR